METTKIRTVDTRGRVALGPTWAGRTVRVTWRDYCVVIEDIEDLPVESGDKLDDEVLIRNRLQEERDEAIVKARLARVEAMAQEQNAKYVSLCYEQLEKELAALKVKGPTHG